MGDKNTKSSEQEIPKDILTLLTVIKSLPLEYRQRFELIAKTIKENTLRRKRMLSLFQDAHSQFRLDMKYLIFDLEATRRERDDYRRKLEESDI